MTAQGADARSSVIGIAPCEVCRVTSTVPVVGGLPSGGVFGLAAASDGLYVQVDGAAVGAGVSSAVTTK